MRRIGSLVPYLKKEEVRMRLFSSVASDQTVSVKLGEYLGRSNLSSFSRESTGRCFASRLWIGGESVGSLLDLESLEDERSWLVHQTLYSVAVLV